LKVFGLLAKASVVTAACRAG